MAAVIVLREGPKDGAFETVEELNGTFQANNSEFHVPALDVSVSPPKNVMAIYLRAPDEPGIDAPVWRYHRSEPVYRPAP